MRPVAFAYKDLANPDANVGDLLEEVRGGRPPPQQPARHLPPAAAATPHLM